VPKVLILCPTYDHAETLFASVGTARAQTFTEWEMAIIGDGSPERTYEIIDTLASEDGRIRGYRNPKDVRFGEPYRDPVIRGSDAEFVCHLSDDDLWAPTHLAEMVALLEYADWVNQAPIRILADGMIEWWPINQGTPAARAATQKRLGLSAGINYVAYRREAYLRLPEGWTSAPWEEGASDQYMWSKFHADPSISIASIAKTTALKLPSRQGRRSQFTPDQRLAELAPWMVKIGDPRMLPDLCRKGSVGRRLARLFAIHDTAACGTLEEAFEQSGIRPAPITTEPIPAVDGAAMVTPLTDGQRDEAWLAWAMLRVFAGGDDGKTRTQLLAKLESDELRMATAILALGRDCREAAIAAAETFRTLIPNSPRLVRIQGHLLAGAGRLSDAEEILTEMERRWPKDRETKRLRKGLSQPPVASPKE
jgi:hypothetical protein